TYIEFIFPVSTQAQKDELIAQLSVRGFEGFEEERTQVRAFIPEQDLDAEELAAFAREQGLQYSLARVENRNWNAEWEANFQPVIIGQFCAVRAGFHPPVPGVKHDIIITPKMSFGTGHHATTYMMVQAMEMLDFRDRQVFDFGTGTGVLAILAEQLGANHIIAIDNDDNSIENATENLLANGCSRSELFKAETTAELGQFDIILANINRNVILQNLVHMAQHLSPDGVVLLSGLLSNDQEQVVGEAKKQRLELTGRLEKDGWICLKMGKTSA
ncbi:MAG: 50S ribosomal protein L11 methyltransferase, partial [Bacteroidetes bacterium]|nr:50S ribosomal protein L11 methyltransferase [Bacteroidota bacterium]